MINDQEKNIDSQSILSRHTEDYNLSIARSNPSNQNLTGTELKKGLQARHVSMIALGGALGTVCIF